MMTITQFEHRLAELNLDALDRLSPDALPELRNRLHGLAEDLTREMHVIRTQYQGRISAANSGGSSQVLVSNRQSGSSGRRAGQVEKLEAERDQKLAPFTALRQKIDEHLAAVEKRMES